MEEKKQAENQEISFIIRRAEEEDVPDLFAMMEEAASDTTHPDWFVPSDIAYIRRNLSVCGITVIARTTRGEAAGFFVIELPEGGEETLTGFLGFTEEQRMHTAVMDTAVVARRFRGHGLQYRMLRFCEEELSDRDLRYFLTTVHPDNKYSLNNMQKGGFEIVKRVRCYEGKDRYLLMKKSPNLRCEEEISSGRDVRS